ncbi:hypothetical protein BD289DRAFT_243835 [Coniella lustricola]|uniref:Uncharacterized protein n=1 Tax=Coniella lustricola TaxID=2025994 RepID=A0A2T3A971_9PEZI|nr:hypothetical protein BD289DRAFT_243835 [Coniella lustricola]
MRAGPKTGSQPGLTSKCRVRKGRDKHGFNSLLAQRRGWVGGLFGREDPEIQHHQVCCSTCSLTFLRSKIFLGLPAGRYRKIRERERERCVALTQDGMSALRNQGYGRVPRYSLFSLRVVIGRQNLILEPWHHLAAKTRKTGSLDEFEQALFAVSSF